MTPINDANGKSTTTIEDLTPRDIILFGEGDAEWLKAPFGEDRAERERPLHHVKTANPKVVAGIRALGGLKKHDLAN